MEQEFVLTCEGGRGKGKGSSIMADLLQQVVEKAQPVRHTSQVRNLKTEGFAQ
jgi:hypothetical protein